MQFTYPCILGYARARYCFLPQSGGQNPTLSTHQYSTQALIHTHIYLTNKGTLTQELCLIHVGPTQGGRSL